MMISRVNLFIGIAILFAIVIPIAQSYTHTKLFDGYISIIVSSRFTLDHNSRCLQDQDYYDDDDDSDAYEDDAGEFVEKFQLL